VIRGRGTPLVLDSPREFVASGPYRIVRNPLYIGSTTFFLGMGLCLRSVSVLLFAFGWVIFVHLFVVYFEEPDLQRKFGATYEAYWAGVPRWMPRVRRTKRAQ
jgi:protein-S-isoprenylcysteine O-methyltransferase Ste14